MWRCFFSFMASIELQKAVQGYENYINVHGIDEDVINAYVMASETALNVEKDKDFGLKISKRAKEVIEAFVLTSTGGTIWDLEKYQQNNQTLPYDIVNKYYQILKLESFYLFESFIFYMEKNRSWKKRFYQPRRKTLKCVVDDLQSLEDKTENRVFYGLSMPSRVGKSTVCIFFLAWIAFKRPNSHSAMGGHSGILAKSFYKELLNIIITPEYTFKELYDYFHPGFSQGEEGLAGAAG